MLVCTHQAQEHEYDIIGHPQLNFSFVVVFPFHPYTDGRIGGEVGLCGPCMFSWWVTGMPCFSAWLSNQAALTKTCKGQAPRDPPQTASRP